MANLLTRKQVAELINKTPGYVGMYIKRGKLIEENKRIDTDNSANKHFISKYITKELSKNTAEEVEKNEDQDGKGKINQGNIDYIVRQHDLKLKITKLEREELEIKKKKAKVVPVDFIIEMFSGYIKTNIVGINSEVDKMISELIDEFGGDYETKLKYKKRLRELINSIFKNNHESISKDIIEKAKDYAINARW